jgi:hypothetical protein
MKPWVRNTTHRTAGVIHVQGNDTDSGETRNVRRLLNGKSCLKRKVVEGDSREKNVLNEYKSYMLLDCGKINCLADYSCDLLGSLWNLRFSQALLWSLPCSDASRHAVRCVSTFHKTVVFIWIMNTIVHPRMALQPLPGLGLPQKLPPFIPIFSFSPPAPCP